MTIYFVWMSKPFEEWLKQAEYDLDTAEYMYKGRRYFYAVFMAHLAVEKALKGLYQRRFERVPPRTHDLIYLAEQMDLEPPEQLYDFMIRLHKESVPTRYPEQLARMLQNYTRMRSREILDHSHTMIQWIKTQQ